MHRSLQFPPLRSLTWVVLGLVAAIALLATYINLLQSVVQRGEWRASQAQVGVVTATQADSRQINPGADASTVLLSDGVPALLPVVAVVAR